MAEMVTYLPISSPFIRFAGRYVDEAFGMAAGYNFFIFEAALEIVACNVIIHYWSDIVPAGGVIAIVIFLSIRVSPLFSSAPSKETPHEVTITVTFLPSQPDQHRRRQMVRWIRILARPSAKSSSSSA